MACYLASKDGVFMTFFLLICVNDTKNPASERPGVVTVRAAVMRPPY
jgi:hypothetical protein